MAGFKFFLSTITFLFSLLIAIIALSGAISSYINPNSSGLIALAGVLLPVSLLANLFFIFYWFVTKKKWWIISLLAVVANTNYLLSIYQFNSPILNTNKGKEIVIASNNVHRFLTNHRITFHTVTTWAAKEKIEVICFQEYSQLHFSSDSIQKIFNSYPFHSTFSKGKELCIFSKYPIIRSQNIDFQMQEGQGEWIDISSGKDTIRIFNVHLQQTKLLQKSGIRKNEVIELIYRGFI